jgi:dTDP-4-dehydrorhamnose 3,5-epimerase-like enzyme
MPLAEVKRLATPEVMYFRYRLFEDERGFFAELWKRTEYLAAGLPFDFVQVNLSYSRPYVVRGRVFDTAVDIRRGSPYFGGWVVAELDWRSKMPWEVGLRRTVEWYLANRWWEPLVDGYVLRDEPW